MSEIQISFNNEMRELFEYTDPSFPLVVWTGDFCSFINRSLSYHWHNEFEYCIVLAGIVGFTIEGNYIEAKQGEAIFINANSMHLATQVSKNDAKVVTVSFLPILIAGNEYSTVYRKFFLPILQSTIKGFLIENSKRFGNDILQYLTKIYTAYPEQNYDYELMCINYISHIWNLTLAYLQEHKDTLSLQNIHHNDEQKAKDILNYIHNYYDEDIKIDDIARYAKTSRSGCFRCFRQYTNKSPIEYLTEYRLSRAIYLMIRTDKSMTQIAAECGFSNSSYFGKVFMQKYKMTPLQYKKMLKLNTYKTISML